MGKKLTWSEGRRATWADAEQVCPGIEAEWRSMLGTKHYTETILDGHRVRLQSPMPPTGHDWYIRLHDGVRDPFDYSEPESPCSWMVEVVQVDTSGRWHSPPMWRRWPDGSWTAPMGVPRLSLLFQPMVYRPYRPIHYVTIDATIDTSGSCTDDCGPGGCGTPPGRCRSGAR